MEGKQREGEGGSVRNVENLCRRPGAGCRGHGKSGSVIWDWSPAQNRCTLRPRRRCRPPSGMRGQGGDGRDGQGSEGIIR